jgi:hypothetical protein
MKNRSFRSFRVPVQPFGGWQETAIIGRMALDVSPPQSKSRVGGQAVLRLRDLGGFDVVELFSLLGVQRVPEVDSLL